MDFFRYHLKKCRKNSIEVTFECTNLLDDIGMLYKLLSLAENYGEMIFSAS